MTRILEALKNNNPIEAKKLINLGQPVDVRDEQGFTALHIAVLNADLELTHHLLEAGACPNIHADYNIKESQHALQPLNPTEELFFILQQLGNKTPLHIATCQNNHDMLKLLLAYGANPNITDAGLCTPLHWAATKGMLNQAAILLEYGANVNAKDLALSTPLHEAVRNQHVTMVQLLITYKADHLALDITGITPIMLSHKNPQIMLCLQPMINCTMQ